MHRGRYCHVIVTKTSFGLLNEFVDCLLLITTNTYTTLAILYTLQILVIKQTTSLRNLPYEFTCLFLVAA